MTPEWRQLWDDYRALLLKRAIILSEEATEWAIDVVNRYIAFLWKFTTRATLVVSTAFLAILLFSSLGITWTWLYQFLVFMMMVPVALMMVAALPVIGLVQGGYGALPKVAQEEIAGWIRRGGNIIFVALFIIVYINVFNLHQHPEKIPGSILLIITLSVGAAFGWWSIPNHARTFVGSSMMVLLLVIGVSSRFPMARDVVDWASGQAQARLDETIRPVPPRYHPESAEELNAAFFNQGTGESRIWYSQDEEGNYQFFTEKGFDARGRPLQRAEEEEEIEAIVAWQREEDALSRQQREKERAEQERRMAERQAEEARQQQEAKQQREKERAEQERLMAERQAEEARQRQEARQAFDTEITRVTMLRESRQFDAALNAVEEAQAVLRQHQPVLEEEFVSEANRNVGKLQAEILEAQEEYKQLAAHIAIVPSERVECIIAFSDPHGNIAPRLLPGVVEVLASRGIDASTSVFSEQFAGSEAFRDLMSGKGDDFIQAVHLEDFADRILMLEGVDLRSENSGLPPSYNGGAITYRKISMRLNVAFVDVATGAVQDRFSIEGSVAAGLSEAAAIETYVERTVDEFQKRIGNSVLE